jgi:arylsulfatase
MFGCRAIYHEGWKAVTYHQIQFDEPGLDKSPWELYDVRVDPSECHDLAGDQPDKLAELIELWWREAERYDVLPLDNRPFSELVFGRPPGTPPRGRYEYFPDRIPVPEAVAVNVRNRSHRVIVELEVPDGGPAARADPPAVEGVLIAQGSLLGGWALYVKDGELRYVHNLSGRTEDCVTAPIDLGPGSHLLGFRFDKLDDTMGGTGTLVVDGADVATVEIPMFTPHRFSLTGAGLTVGYQPEFAVSDDIEAPFPFTGTIVRALIEVDGEPFLDPEQEANDAIARQ